MVRGARARGIAADVPPFPEGNGGTGADSPTARRSRGGSPKTIFLLLLYLNFYFYKNFVYEYF
jgi:hypothetical protein